MRKINKILGKKVLVLILTICFIITSVAVLPQEYVHAFGSDTVTIVAGNGNSEFSGDGGAATLAGLNKPQGVAVDSSGNIYIADTINRRIRKIDGAGNISTIAGDGTINIFTGFFTPYGVAIDAAGNIYVADRAFNNVRKIDVTGVITTIAGTGPGYFGDGGMAIDAKLDSPEGIAVDGSGNIYIADKYNHRIRKIDALSGIISTVAGTGIEGYSGDGDMAIAAQLNYPSGVAVDISGNIYIADFNNNRIRKVSANGVISTLAGNGFIGSYGDGGMATSAALNHPSGVAVDGNGNIYIADNGNSRVRKIDTSGRISTIADSSSNGLSIPNGVAVDLEGNVYIADTNSNYIKKVVLGRTISGNAGVSGAILSYTEGGIDKTVTADGTGDYSFTVPRNWSGTVIPQKSGYTFLPADRLYSNVAFDQTNQDYTVNVIPGAYTASASVNTTTPITGANNSITLTVRDSLGDIDTNFNDTKNVSISGVQAAPDGSYGSFNGIALDASAVVGQVISTTFINGVATLNLVLNKAGTQTITFSIEGVTTPATNSLLITPMNPPNQAPILTTAGPFLPSIKTNDMNSIGHTVVSFIGTSIVDADAGAIPGIAITSSTGNGIWQYSITNGVTWYNLGAVSSTESLLLRDIDKIRYVPDNSIETANITYRAWDSTTGTVGNRVDTSANGGTKAFSTATDTVSISVVAINTTKAITNFNLEGLTPIVVGTINEGAKTIVLTAPYGTNVTSLVPTISHTGVSITPNTGAAQDFTNPVAYTVTAEDGLTQEYVATVTVAVNTAKAITNFNFEGLTPIVAGTINEGAKTIVLTVPYGTNVAALVPTISYTGASITPNTGAAQDFTNPVDYTVTAEDGLTQEYIASVIIEPQKPSVGGSDYSGGDSTPTPTQPISPSITDAGTIIIVNGDKLRAAAEIVKQEAGRKIVTIGLNPEVMSKSIKVVIDKHIETGKKEDNIIIVPVMSKDVDSLTITLTGEIIKQMETNEFKLYVKSNDVDYIIPAKEVDIDKVSKMLGVSAPDLVKISIDIKIDKADHKMVESILSNANAQGYEVIFPPVVYSIIARTTTKTGEEREVLLSNFNQYIERIMEIPATVDPSEITTGVVYSLDGSFAHIPTQVFQQDGKYYAKLKSLTNSVYTIIRTSIKVPSVEKHWSEEAVNDMAARLIIKNPDAFIPDGYITRGDFAEYITKALGLYRTGTTKVLKFTDVGLTHELVDAVSIATEYGIITGYPDGSFRPNNAITREEAMVMYARAMKVVGLVGRDNPLSGEYQDENEISTWAYNDFKKVVSAGVFNGKADKTIDPKGTFTYSEAATAIRNLLIKSELIN